jgi:DNA-binding Lrp family transcriptional regulator
MSGGVLKMISNKDAEILSHFRNNARKKITFISRDLNIPATTIYDKLRVHEKKYVKKHSTLLDFPKLGLHTKAHISIKTDKNSKEALQNYLMQQPNINSLSRLGFGSDFMAEVVFRNIGELESFSNALESNYNIEQLQIFNVVEELKKEDFLTKIEHMEVLR